jgi:hypothetical protein
MSSSKIAQVEQRNADLLDENAKLRRQLAVLAGQKVAVDKRLALATRRLQILIHHGRKTIERMQREMQRQVIG